MLNPKRCPDCGKLFPATSESFYKNSAHSDNLDTYCKACRKKRQGARYEENREHLCMLQRRYYSLHRQDELARGRQFREANPDYMKHHYQSNKNRRDRYTGDYREQEKSLRKSFHTRNSAKAS
jgi:hypothetical protein